MFTLPGIDQARAQLRGLVPRSPLSHLVGYRVTQVGSGSATLSMPASPWLQHADGTLEVRILAEAALATAALTAAPPATDVTTATLSVNYLRAPALDDDAYIARAQVVHSVRTFTLAEVTVEDAQGRAAVHATGSMLMSAVDLPTRAAAPDAGFEEPSYPTPDPYQRPHAADFPRHLLEEADGLEIMRMLAGAEAPGPAIQDLLGCRWVEAEEGFVSLTLEASEWLCRRSRVVSPGVLFSVAQMGLSGAVWTVCPADRRVGALDQTISFLRPVPAKGGELVIRGRLVHTGERLLISSVEVTDPDGNPVGLGHQTSVLAERHRNRGRAESQRILATVLFTDIVASTKRAEELGDARWCALLVEHNALVRRQIELFKGREVKSTGDGFLVTFDAPTRAVQCARAIRDGLGRLGLQIRAGLHTGECELAAGDVTGAAVHVASRVQSSANPGEILISRVVHDLVSGSGLRTSERGTHRLKGLDGEWSLFGVED
jgi:uncharacterized protein (TIGR00369 family)